MSQRGPQPGRRFGGRQKGTPNKTTRLLREAILQAAEEAGGDDGLVGYLRQQAFRNPTAFLSLLGKVLPLQHAGELDDPEPITRIERVIIDAPLDVNEAA